MISPRKSDRFLAEREHHLSECAPWIWDHVRTTTHNPKNGPGIQRIFRSKMDDIIKRSPMWETPTIKEILMGLKKTAVLIALAGIGLAVAGVAYHF